jgi:ectoine hydroxylase-related dioxygenase (phytanoyl-CoA dioxygenase family)
MDFYRYTPNLQEGDIVLFPSTLEHYVTHNNTDTIRSTISANFKFWR